MRYAIFSDIHGNRPAWDAVLNDMRALEADVLVCLGDVVGYGPKPQEVLDGIRSVTSKLVLGNHDAAAAGILDASIFNNQAREVIEWTRGQLSDEAIQFLREAPLLIEDEDLLFVHAEMEEPGRFHYIDSEEDARTNFQAAAGKITFIGHTHHPCVFEETPEGAVARLPDDDRILDRESRYIVNVGSVGEPRNPDDISARYVIYDDDSRAVIFRRVEFDAEAYRAELQASGLRVTPYFLQVVDHYQEALSQSQAAGHAMMVDMQTASIQPVSLSTAGRRVVMSPVERRSSALVVSSIAVLLTVVAGAMIWFSQIEPEPVELVGQENEGGSMVADTAGGGSPGSGTPRGLDRPAPIPTEVPAGGAKIEMPDAAVEQPPTADVPDPTLVAEMNEPGEPDASPAPLLPPAEVISHWKMDDPENSTVFADTVGEFPLGRYQAWSSSDPIAPDPVPLTLQENKSSARVRLLGERPENAGTFALKGDAGFTYEGWFHAGDQKTVTLGTTLNGDVAGGWRVALLRGEAADGFAAFMYENGETKVQALGRNLKIFDDQPHHFAAVWDPKAASDAGQLSIFIDSEQVGTAMLAHADLAGGTSNPFQVGSAQGEVTVDELRFSATALTPDRFLAAGDNVLFDFEGDSFEGWTVEGTAFGSQPASGQVTARKSFTGREGEKLAHSSHGGDGSTGKLTSAPFKIANRYLRVLVAGGPHQGQTYVGLEIEGELVHRTTGQENLEFVEVLWDLSPFANKEAKFVAVDQHGGRWGVIAFDHVVLTNRPGTLTPLPPLE